MSTAQVRSRSSGRSNSPTSLRCQRDFMRTSDRAPNFPPMLRQPHIVGTVASGYAPAENPIHCQTETSRRARRRTAMQWPPTPGPGCRMSTRGWRLASPMSSQGSTRRESHTSEISFANAMFTSRYAFSVSFTSSAVARAGYVGPAADEHPRQALRGCPHEAHVRRVGLAVCWSTEACRNHGNRSWSGYNSVSRHASHRPTGVSCTTSLTEKLP